MGFNHFWKRGASTLKKRIKPVKNVIINQTLKLSPDQKESNNNISENETFVENLKISFDLAKISLNNELTRSEKLDNKFNFLLVFVAGLITTLNIVFPYSEDISKCEFLINNIIVGSFMACMLASCILIFIGMIPRSHQAIDEKIFTDMDFHSNHSQNVLGGYIKGLSDSSKNCHAINEKKAKILKAAFILAMCSFFFVCILLIIKIF